ncbi:MAG TPA: 6-phospho-3-hexuloisomerase [Dongiaceae bacterium]|jgi:6-phospho-3-hexuloisomerase|nr:6-phospho-3-hexuloisomerase [Dongiaceae bacterium]
MSASIADIARGALNDAERVVEKLNTAAFESFAQAIDAAKTIALHGLGREGLQMKGLAMRLFHLGLDAHVVGEMTTPPIGKGDLLICSAGPGDFTTIAALMKIAKDAGAKTAVVTAQPSSNLAKSADYVLHIPAQTMADDQGANTSVLPMGSLFELSQMLVFELLVLRLREIKGESAAAMRARHTNLE